jgi:hypothetical protein
VDVQNASFDFAQDEDEPDVPSTICLFLSEVEGRTIVVPGSSGLSIIDPREMQSNPIAALRATA